MVLPWPPHSWSWDSYCFALSCDLGSLLPTCWAHFSSEVTSWVPALLLVVGPHPGNPGIGSTLVPISSGGWASSVPSSSGHRHHNISFLKTCLFICEREGGEGQREDLKQALHCQHRVLCGAWTHEPWAEIKSWTLNWQPPRCPNTIVFLMKF